MCWFLWKARLQHWHVGPWASLYWKQRINGMLHRKLTVGMCLGHWISCPEDHMIASTIHWIDPLVVYYCRPQSELLSWKGYVSVWELGMFVAFDLHQGPDSVGVLFSWYHGQLPYLESGIQSVWDLANGNVLPSDKEKSSRLVGIWLLMKLITSHTEMTEWPVRLGSPSRDSCMNVSCLWKTYHNRTIAVNEWKSDLKRAIFWWTA